MKRFGFNVLRLLAVAMLLPWLASCEVEFSPNAQWKNIPVVYCVLDQDDDTSWVRVERCYLSDDGAMLYGSNPDSINYREGEISVAILAYEGDRQRDSIPFAYTLRQRDSGAFAGGMQPVYFCETRGRLKENYDYFLNVRTADGKLLASSSPVRLIKQTEEALITAPTGNYGFSFYSNGSNCKIAWNNLANARIYQPVVRFYYGVEGETRYVDLNCQRYAPPYNSQKSEIFYPLSRFLTDLRTLLQQDTASRKEYLKRVDIYLTCCTEDLNAYLSTAAQGSNVEQSHETYTNIKGGLGVFAARRTHLYKSMKSDASETAGEGLYWHLRNLGVGLYLP